MAEIGLQGAHIVPSVRERIAASVAEHVGVGLEGQLGSLAGTFDYSGVV